MQYEVKKFNHLLGLAGFSDKLLENHFTLYQGYVNNFNKLDEILVGMEKEEKYGTPEFAELNRRLSWEFNGMRLHEFYFGNLTPVAEQKLATGREKEPQKINEQSDLFKAIIKEFSSYEFWEKDFRAMGAMRGIGWIILYYDKVADRLFNVWVNEHDTGHFSGCVPLLVMDVFEHAYMLDYGIKKNDYVDVFIKMINWKVVSERL